ncbi:ABC transporter substrate-binding protein [Candidatus Puniceispirillum sp.]|nr:ABC transporter substrate-binding protein [Candidatus Puniceispirillum sp.]
MIHSCKQENLLYRTFLSSRYWFSIVFLLILLLGNIPAQSSTQVESANQLINNMIKDVESYLDSDSGDINKRTANITKLLDNHFDLPGIARFSAGPYWRAATKGERITYTLTMRDVLIGTIVRNFDQLAGLSFTITSSQAKGDKMVLVRGTFEDKMGNRSPISVGWRITTPNSSPAKVLDVEIENISMLVTQKQENIAIIRKNAGRFAALIETMKKRQKTQ